MAEITLTTSGTALTLTASGQSLTFETAGELNAAANVGGGDAEVFRDKIGAVLNFRTISGIGDIVVVENGDVIEISGGGAGDVIGPAAATDEAVARFNTTTGKLLQNSLVTVDDSGNFATPGTVDGLGGIFRASGAVLVAADAGDNALVDSPKLNLSANFDSDPGAGVTPTARDFEMQHVMLTGGASPTSKVSFSFAGVEEMRLDRFPTSVFLSRSGASSALLQLDNSFVRLLFGSAEVAVNNVGVITMKAAGTTWASYNVAGPGNTMWKSAVPDSATAVGFEHQTTVLDKDTFTAGALHTKWQDAGGDTIMSLNPAGDLRLINGGIIGTGPANAQITFSTTEMTLDVGGSGDRINFRWGNVIDYEISSDFTKVTHQWNSTTTERLTQDNAAGFVLTTAAAIDLQISSTSKIKINSTGIGLYGTAPAAQSAAYTRNAVVVEDRTLLASASATVINNNNVLAALIADLQSRGFIG